MIDVGLENVTAREIESYNDVDRARKAEDDLLQKTPTALNLHRGGSWSWALQGKKRTPEERRSISEGLKNANPETKKRMTDRARAMGQANVGKTRSPELRAQISETMRKKALARGKWTDEQRAMARATRERNSANKMVPKPDST
jgi:hypothetical protein